MSNIPEGVLIYHARTPDQTKAGKGGITYAMQPEDQGVRVAESYCSPRDNFSRKMGRTVAIGRLNSAKLSYVIPWDKFPPDCDIDSATGRKNVIQTIVK